jgi:hypothetical protein
MYSHEQIDEFTRLHGLSIGRWKEDGYYYVVMSNSDRSKCVRVSSKEYEGLASACVDEFAEKYGVSTPTPE